MKKILLISMFVLSLFILSSCEEGRERHHRGTTIDVDIHH